MPRAPAHSSTPASICDIGACWAITTVAIALIGNASTAGSKDRVVTEPPAPHQQPEEDRRAGGLRPAHRRARADRGPSDRRESEIPEHEARQARASPLVPPGLKWPEV